MAYGIQNPRMRACGVAVRTAFAVIPLSQFAVIYNYQAHASEASFDDFPFMVHCEVKGVDHAFYLSKIGTDGVAVYITPGRLAGTVTIDGKSKPVGANGPGSCSGKTLEQLRSAGQAYYLRR